MVTQGTEFCPDDTDIRPTITGTVSGTFYSSPAGLDINPQLEELILQDQVVGLIKFCMKSPLVGTQLLLQQ